jgi:nitrogen-specific signal transduction histidine kinase
VVLDAQLCVIYANWAAQDALAFRVDQVRGRPIGDLLDESSGLVAALRRALETGQCIADREHPVGRFGPSRYASGLDLTITPLGSQVTGTHLLLEKADHSPRRRLERATRKRVGSRSGSVGAATADSSVKGPLTSR